MPIPYVLLVAAAASINFDTHLQDHMVLQRAPAAASVYGYFSAPGAAVDVRVTVDDGAQSYTVPAKTAGSNWTALLQPEAAGGSYKIVVNCSGCTGNATDTIVDVTFGDVWYCSGQSNMALPLTYTFSRNKSAAAIGQGKYRNIRMHQLISNMGNAIDWIPAGTAIEPPTAPNTLDMFTQFSATCYYFAESLTDLLGADAPPLGMINTAWGGSMAEQWTSNQTSAKCSNITLDATSGTLFAERVVPFAKMTLKGFVWYQGENDMGNVFGNAAQNRGYACEVPAMIEEWRTLFSQSGQTSPSAPFGLVTIANSGSEGHPDMGGMHLAQMGSYGLIPNPAMPNTFLGHAYDLDDPYYNQTCWGDNCCTPEQSPKPGQNCDGCDAFCATFAATNAFMGNLHPRPKKPLGVRLAQAAYGTVYSADVQTTGPVISGCEVNGGELVIKFNTTLLGKDSVTVGPYWESHVDILTNASLFCLQANNPLAATLCKDNGAGQEVVFPTAINLVAAWSTVNITSAGTSSISADVSSLAGSVYGVRYMWGGFCCDGRPPTSDPCPVASCPLKGSPSQLPANPFVAKIVNGKCSCVAPQVCDE
ncbi:hypothetical protein DIPPA_18274 [Diplonema papillatum]|nr:hypothetical protein DIPPA_18274 [Diplonema papillatum]